MHSAARSSAAAAARGADAMRAMALRIILRALGRKQLPGDRAATKIPGDCVRRSEQARCCRRLATRRAVSMTGCRCQYSGRMRLGDAARLAPLVNGSDAGTGCHLGAAAKPDIGPLAEVTERSTSDGASAPI